MFSVRACSRDYLSTFQDLYFDVSLSPLFINWCYNLGIKKLPNHWWTRWYYFSTVKLFSCYGILIRSNAFLFTSKGLTLEGFTTLMDCCLRTRASNFVRNEVDYLGGIDWMAAEEDVLCRTPLIAVVLNSLNTPALNIECSYRRWAKHDFSTIVKSKYRGNQIQEDLLRFLLTIWSQALAHCFRLLAG